MCILLLTSCGDATSISVPSAGAPSSEQSDLLGALQIGATSSPQDTGRTETPSRESAAPQESTAPPAPTATPNPTPNPTPEPTPFVPLRDNTPYCPSPVASGTVTYGNDVTTIDASNLAQGYIMANYTGTCPKVKLLSLIHI